jgi:tetratricopeptide (TPR) repeat protein
MSKSRQDKSKSVSGILLAAIAIISTLALIVVVSSPNNNSTSNSSISGDLARGEAASELSAARKSPSLETATAKGVTADTQQTAGAPADARLKPSDPFDTQLEQQRLLEAVEATLAKFPSDSKLLHLGAVTYAELLQTERAIELFEKSLTIAPSDPQALVAYAELLLKIGRVEEAVLWLERGRPVAGSTTSVNIALAKAYGQSSKPEEALAVLSQSSPEPEHAAEFKLELARVQNQLQQFAEAEANARDVVKGGTAERGAYLELSTALMRQGKREQAMEVRSNMPPIEQQIAPGEQKYQVWFRRLVSHTYAVLGSAFEAKGLWEQAEDRLLYALAIDGSSDEALTTLIGLLRKQGRIPEAIKLQQTAVEAAPENILHAVNLASLAAAVQDFDLAERSLRRAVKLDETGQAELRLAQFLMGVGKPVEAVETARQAVANLGSLDAHLVLLVTLQNQGDRLATVQAYLDAKKLFPNAPQLADFQP